MMMMMMMMMIGLISTESYLLQNKAIRMWVSAKIEIIHDKAKGANRR